MFCFDNARPRLGAFLYKNFNDNDFSYRPFNFSSNKWDHFPHTDNFHVIDEKNLPSVPAYSGLLVY